MTRQEVHRCKNLCFWLCGNTKVWCCAFGCKEKFSIRGPVTFHSFPKDEIRRQLWSSKLRRENFTASDSTRICSKHFTPDCFDTERFGGTWLKKSAVPTIFDFPSHLQPKANNRKTAIKRSADIALSNPESSKKR
nr:THAP domain-containing protein 2-like [Parasteatoda tepidariorum]